MPAVHEIGFTFASPTRKSMFPRSTHPTITRTGVVDAGSLLYLATRLAQALFTVSGYKRVRRVRGRVSIPLVAVVDGLTEQ